jgi:NitT/TauT family transport system permease protein
MIWVLAGLMFWAAAWWLNVQLSRMELRALGRAVVPALFGITVLVVWECLVRGLQVNPVILPPPSVIGVQIAASLDLLWIDLMTTFITGALSGYLMGCGAAVFVAVLIDRSPFLQKGLLPIGNFMAALPIVGVAPIMVMWFGFGWQSKAAVVAIMVFFPVLVNMGAGLAATDRMQRDLMETYAASYWQTLLKLRLPAAMPFLFNGLKIGSTLALIGAIVAEYFGSPIRGMGFRISTEMGRLGLDMVWAEIAVAALAGSLFYGAIALIERGVTFWHPSQRI